MSTNKFDYIIIGAGLSGLIQAAIYAKEGAKVCILEKQPIPGGYLQTFSRKKYRFDTGFHYVGCTRRHKPLRKYLEYLEIFDKLPCQYYPRECFFEVATRENSFRLPTRFDDFIAKLIAQFPQDRAGLGAFQRLVEDVTASFRWYDLRPEQEYSLWNDALPTCSIRQWLDQHMHSRWPKEILAAFSFNLGLEPEEVPVIPYCACFDSIFDDPIWLYDGGDGLIHPLVDKLRELAVEIHFKKPVTWLECGEKRKVTAAHTEGGEVFYGDWIISTIHPKITMKILDDKALRPVFKQRIYEMQESRGSFAVHLILKRELTTIDPINYLCLVDSRTNDGLYSGFYFNSPSLLNAQIRPEEQSKPRLSLCSFVDSMPFIEFRGSRFGKRPPTYTQLKEHYQQLFLADLLEFVPELEDNILQVYTSSPLTNEHYTGSFDGAAFGISHDVEYQGIHRPSPRTRVKNLLLSGQSINIPGICGVAINAFYTASMTLGEQHLFDKVLAAQ